MKRGAPWLLVGALAAGWYLYRNSAAAKAAGAAASLTPAAGGGVAAGSSPALPVLPGSSATTASQVFGAQAFWNTLTPASPPNAGYINFPSGTQVPAATLGAGNTAMDDAGNVYVLWGGQVYALAFPDANGNWPATPVQS